MRILLAAFVVDDDRDMNTAVDELRMMDSSNLLTVSGYDLVIEESEKHKVFTATNALFDWFGQQIGDPNIPQSSHEEDFIIPDGTTIH